MGLWNGKAAGSSFFLYYTDTECLARELKPFTELTLLARREHTYYNTEPHRCGHAD